MSATELQVKVEEFPPRAKAFLRAFYEAKGVTNGGTAEKIKALREGYGLEDAVISSDGGTTGEEGELRTIEFYALTKNRII